MALPTYRREEDTHTKLAAGDYRCVVVSAEETISSTQKAMIKIGLRPSGSKMIVYNYIVEGDWWNINLTRFFDSFDVKEGDMNLMGWVGAEGAMHLKEDGDYLKCAYFINKRKAEKLPEFVGDKPERQVPANFEEISSDDELPF